MRRPSRLALWFLLAAVLPIQDALPETVVGSRHSHIFHRPDCSNARQIAPDNLVSWASVDAARRAGYRPGQRCFRPRVPD